MSQVLRIAAFVVAVTAMGAAQAQQPPSSAAPAQAKPDMKACQDAMARHSQMMKETEAADARLQQQVKAMQAAKGQARVDAVAQVVSTIVEQRAAERARMMAMHEQMMMHAMSHAGQGAAAMQQCPMMQHMQKSEGAQHQH